MTLDTLGCTKLADSIVERSLPQRFNLDIFRRFGPHFLRKEIEFTDTPLKNG